MNTAFETIIIVSKYGKDKHIEWSINDKLIEEIPKIKQIVSDYAKKVVRETHLEGSFINCEDSDEE